MNSQDKLIIRGIDKLNNNEIGFSKKKIKKNNCLILIVIEIFLFFVIYLFLLTLKKKLIILKYNQKVLNKEIIKKLDFIEDKLKALESFK